MNENHRDLILGTRVREMSAEARARHLRAGAPERPLRAVPHPLASLAKRLAGAQSRRSAPYRGKRRRPAAS